MVISTQWPLLPRKSETYRHVERISREVKYAPQCRSTKRGSEWIL